MPNVRLVEETNKLFDLNWLKEVNCEFFQETAARYHRTEGPVLRIFGYFINEERALTLLVQDSVFMLEILAITRVEGMAVRRVIDRLLRYTNRPSVVSYSSVYDETYISMGLPISTVNYARPIVPGPVPDPERFTLNVGQLFRSQKSFVNMAMSIFQNSGAVHRALTEGGKLALLVLESGRQILTLISRGEKRWIVSAPFYSDDHREPLSDRDFSRVMSNILATLNKGDMLVYTSRVNGRDNRVIWLISHGFVPESYMYEKTIEVL